MATLDDAQSLLAEGKAAFLAGNYALAKLKAQAALFDLVTLPNVIQQGADRIERQQVVAAAEKVIQQCDAATTAGRTSPFQTFRLAHKEPTG